MTWVKRERLQFRRSLSDTWNVFRWFSILRKHKLRSHDYDPCNANITKKAWIQHCHQAKVTPCCKGHGRKKWSKKSIKVKLIKMKKANRLYMFQGKILTHNPRGQSLNFKVYVWRMDTSWKTSILHVLAFILYLSTMKNMGLIYDKLAWTVFQSTSIKLRCCLVTCMILI